jgi:hypothetical protein
MATKLRAEQIEQIRLEARKQILAEMSAELRQLKRAQATDSRNPEVHMSWMASGPVLRVRRTNAKGRFKPPGSSYGEVQCADRPRPHPRRRAGICGSVFHTFCA